MMDYVPQHDSPYHLSVTEDSQKARWTIAKYRSGESVGMSVGTTLREAAQQTMVTGLRADEPADPDRD